MSVDQVKAFFEKANADKALAQKLKDAQDAYKGDDGIKDVIIPIAAAAGFNFTVDDYKAAFGKSEGEGEASDAELEAVAGGGTAGAICGVIAELACKFVSLM